MFVFIFISLYLQMDEDLFHPNISKAILYAYFILESDVIKHII